MEARGCIKKTKRNSTKFFEVFSKSYKSTILERETNAIPSGVFCVEPQHSKIAFFTNTNAYQVKCIYKVCKKITYPK